MQETADLWSVYLRTIGVEAYLSGADVGNMMALLKIARMATAHTEDNYVDAATYLAIAGECSEHDREK